MKLLLLSDPTSTHTKKWVTSLSQKNITIALFGLGNYDGEFYNNLKGVKVHSGDIHIQSTTKGKLSYLKAVSILKKIYIEFRPDIVHAHYATSYGMLGGKLKHHPYIISVWGSDIYDFPNRSFFHRQILKKNLSKADVILSTSNNMALETKKYTSDPITITPFGIDLDLFHPKKREANGKLVIGTVKALENIYGIDYLIKAFSLIIANNPYKELELKIAGCGSKEKELQKLTCDLGIEDKVHFMGKVPPNKVPDVLNGFDIYVALSNSESFGVAILEASASEIPVVVSDAEGLKEIVEDGETGFVVKKKNPEEAAKAIQKLIDDDELRKNMGVNGRKHVMEHYNWVKNVTTMIHIYKKLL